MHSLTLKNARMKLFLSHQGGELLHLLRSYNRPYKLKKLYEPNKPSLAARSQAPAWERDCNKSFALNQENEIEPEKEAKASGTGTFPSCSLGTRETVNSGFLSNYFTPELYQIFNIFRA